MLADLRLSIRQLASAPSFSLPTVIGLGVAIAASTAAFSIFHVTLLSARTDRIVAIWGIDTKRAQEQVEACYDDLRNWSSRTDMFDHVALASSVNLDFPILGDGPPR